MLCSVDGPPPEASGAKQRLLATCSCLRGTYVVNLVAAGRCMHGTYDGESRLDSRTERDGRREIVGRFLVRQRGGQDATGAGTGITGRTSMVPARAPGMRAARPMASSRSLASTR